jgi:hypothetical protein
MSQLRSNSEAYLSEASKKLANSIKLLEDSYYDDAARNAYYAMFHAGKALLSLKGIEPKTHHGVISELQGVYVNEGKLKQNLVSALTRDLQVRIRCDYEVMVDVTKEMAEESVKDAREFLKESKDILTK